MWYLIVRIPYEFVISVFPNFVIISSFFSFLFFNEIHFSNYSFSHIVCVPLSCSVEYNVSYVYHAMFAYFDRDNIALKGLAK